MNELKTIDRYETIKPLGRGGMGSVYLARDPRIDRLVAVKMLDAAFDAAARERFAREARAAGRLHHANIVTIFDVGEHDGRPFIAMEYVPGQTLGALIRQGRLGLDEKLRLLADACAGLAYAHRAGIVHLDIKPENLIRHENGVLKILDFGIARLLTADVTHTQQVVGTLRYMAPEQVLGQSLDRRTDVFALGCVIYETIAGEPAFKGTLPDLLSRVTKRFEVPSLAEVVPDVHPELVRMTQRAVASDPAARYDDLEVLRRELESLRGRLNPEAEPTLPRLAVAANEATVNHAVLLPASFSSIARRFRRPRRAAAVAALALATLAAGVFWAVRAGRDDSLASGTIAGGMAAAIPPAAPAETPAVEEPRAGASDVEAQAWRLMARGDRSGVLALLRERQSELSPRFLNELVSAARTTAGDARQAANRRGSQVAASRAYRVGTEQVERATALLARGEELAGIEALWQAAGSFESAGAAPAGPPSTPSAQPAMAEAANPPPPERRDPPPSASARPLPSDAIGEAVVAVPPAPRDAPGRSQPEPSPDRAARVDSGPAPARAPTAEDAIRGVLRAYEAAYDRLDAGALRQLVPGLSAAQQEAIARTFADAISYDVELTVQSIEVAGATATATCMVTHTLVPRIGSASRNTPLRTRFHLRQSADGWVIERIERG